MSDKTWKKAERVIGKMFRSVRIPVTGERHGADIIASDLAIQVKHRKSATLNELYDWLSGINGFCLRQQSEMRGVVVHHRPGKKYDTAIAVLRAEDLAQILEERDYFRETLQATRQQLEEL